ncbi:MAG: zinc ribbon domain-containing protein [Promethearchaeota archaeon]
MINENLKSELAELGRSFYYMGFCLIFQFIPMVNIIALILQIYFIIRILQIVNRINIKLKNPYLEEFRSKFILGIMISIIGVIIFIAVMIIGVFSIIRFSYYYNAISFYILIIAAFAFLFIISLIAGIYQMKAWENLMIFFEQNPVNLPADIIRDSIEGARNLKNASLCYILSFLIVTILIGLILSIIGYFSLGRLRLLDYSSKFYAKSAYQSANNQISPQKSAISNKEIPKQKFCRYCGSKITEDAKFCSICGSKL